MDKKYDVSVNATCSLRQRVFQAGVTPSAPISILLSARLIRYTATYERGQVPLVEPLDKDQSKHEPNQRQNARNGINP